MTETITEETWDELWLDRHSVGCFYCGVMFDERDAVPGPNYEGSVCPACALAGKKTLGETE